MYYNMYRNECKKKGISEHNIMTKNQLMLIPITFFIILTIFIAYIAYRYYGLV